MVRARLALALLIGGIIASGTPIHNATASSPHATVVADAIAYLARYYDPSSGFIIQPTSYPGPEVHYAQVGPAYVVELLAQIGIDPASWPTAGNNILSHVTGDGYAYSTQLRVTHAVGTSGYDPRTFHNEDYVTKVRTGFDGVQFGDASLINDDEWAIFALRAAGVSSSDDQIQKAAIGIENSRAIKGGWNYSRSALQGDTDDTGFALVALTDAGMNMQADSSSQLFASTWDNSTGGFGTVPGQPANCQSTVWALHGYRILGTPPPTGAVAYLAGLQMQDGGFAKNSDNAQHGVSDPMCTAEAAIYFTTADYPLPSFAPGQVVVPEIHALDDATLTVTGPYSNFHWSLSDQSEFEGLTHVFPKAGTYTYSLYAGGQDARWRTSGTLTVLPPRPIAVLAENELHGLQRTPVTLDATPSYEPQGGTISFARVDWGDGTATDGTPDQLSHAYATPGNRTASVRVEDTSGEWSDPTTAMVVIQDQAPVFSDLPSTTLADRAHALSLSPNVTDPDGDPFTLTWQEGDESGTGSASPTFSQLGNFTLTFQARDKWGATTLANTTVDVENLLPTLSNLTLPTAAHSNQTFNYSVEVRDPDGPTPSVTWTFDNDTVAGTNGSISLETPGTYTVHILTRDADGGEADLTTTLNVTPATLFDRTAAPQRMNTTSNSENSTQPTSLQSESEGPTGHESGSSADASHPPVLNTSFANGVQREGNNTGDTLTTPQFVDLSSETQVNTSLSFTLGSIPSAIAYRFDFGDGNQTDWGTSVSTTHAFEAVGVFDVRAYAKAPDGRTTTSSVHITVSPQSRPLSTQAAVNSRSDPIQSMVEQRRDTPIGEFSLIMLAAVLVSVSRGRRNR